MIPNKKELSRRINLKVFCSKLSICPFLVGILTLGTIWGLRLDAMPLGLFAAIAGAGISALIVIARWSFFSESIGRSILNDLLEEAEEERNKSLDELDHKLISDGDPKTEQHLRDLRALSTPFMEDSKSSFKIDVYSSLDVSMAVENLFTMSVAALERSFELWEMANSLSKSAKKAIVKERKQLVEEVGKNVKKLSESLADIQRIRTGVGSDISFDSVTKELTQRIEIAKQVEKEMQEIGRSTAEKVDAGEYEEYLKLADEAEQKKLGGSYDSQVRQEQQVELN